MALNISKKFYPLFVLTIPSYSNLPSIVKCMIKIVNQLQNDCFKNALEWQEIICSDKLSVGAPYCPQADLRQCSPTHSSCINKLCLSYSFHIRQYANDEVLWVHRGTVSHITRNMRCNAFQTVSYLIWSIYFTYK